jgi:peroxiredoxin
MIATKTAVLTKDFSTIDTQCRLIQFSSYRWKKPIVLVFNRGLGGPYCRRHTVQLRQGYQEFIDRNTEVIAVGPEAVKLLLGYWHSEKIPFIGIPDPAHIIAKLFG